MTTRPSPTSPAEILSRTRVRDAMQLGLFHCEPDDDVAAVARTMAEQSIHSVVVAGIVRRDHAGDRLAWGIVSDLDLMRALRPGAEEATAAEVAGTEIVTVSPLESLEQAVAADGRARDRPPGRRLAGHGPAGRHALHPRRRPSCRRRMTVPADGR